ncbi:hypothetical protein KJ758_02680 [Patescibacteria group bacterium]|nr:hypothetical protein [Patescibacteria group bacterium]
MQAQRKVFVRSIYPFIGSVIGVGIFGLPYVFAQSGFLIGVLHLIVLASVNGVVLLTHSDIIMNTKGHSRFTGIVQKYLGSHWSWLVTVLMFGGAWGAMVAYIIIGGEFLKALTSFILDWPTFTFQLIFFSISALLLIGGLGFISKLERIFVVFLLFIIIIILAGAAPHAELINLQTVHPNNWFLPFGVVLFAFGGLAAVPEMADVLGKQKYLLRRALLIGIAIVSLVYVSFAGVIVAVTGDGTSQEGVLGLGAHVGNWIVLAGSVVGLFAVFTSFLILGISVTDTLVYDFKQRYMLSWLVAVLVPFIIFLVGARDFIGVIGFTGAVLGGATGILALYTYWKAKSHACTPKRCLQIPGWIIVLTGLVLLFGVVATMFGL